MGNETPGIQILVSKYHSPIKGTRVPRRRVDLRAGVGNIQDEHGTFYDARK